MIPKTIHYCWFGGGRLPELAKICIRSWKRFCPDYRFICWTEHNFDLDSCVYVREAFDRHKYAFVSDYVRLWAVQRFGGIYLDTDVQLIKGVDRLLTYNAFFAYEDSYDRRRFYIATGLGFGAESNHKILRDLLMDYRDLHFYKDGKEDLTACPFRQSHVFSDWKFSLDGRLQIINGVALLPSSFFCPKNYKTNRLSIKKETLAIHHFAASWKDENASVMRLLIQIATRFEKESVFRASLFSWLLLVRYKIVNFPKRIARRVRRTILSIMNTSAK